MKKLLVVAAVLLGLVALQPTPALAAGPKATTRTMHAVKPKPATQRTKAPAAQTQARKILGPTRSGLPWHSGVWVGGRFSPQTVSTFGTMRGRSADMVTTYSPRDSYRTMAGNDWSITVWKGFPGRLNYGLSLLPDSGEGSLTSIARGDQDWVWKAVASNLKKAGRGSSVVRIGWEANLSDWRWGADAKSATQYRAAFRRVAKVLNATAPGLVIDFGIGCGSGLNGSSDRLAPLKQLYPGDDVVDIVHCDVYDWWTTRVRTSDAAPLVKSPYGPGLSDVAAFARSHRKGMGVGEWGLATPKNGNGGGDNPKFMAAMYAFLAKNADVVTYECYFDEPDSYLRSSIMTGQNPKAAAAYTSRW